MYPAYVFSSLRNGGQLWLPFWTSAFKVSDGPLAFIPSLIISLLVAAFLGLAMHFLIFRPMRYAPALAKVVASIGIYVVLQAIVVLQFGTSQTPVSSVLPSEPITIFGATIGRDRMWVAVAVVIAAIVLTVIYRFTRFGLITRAAAENEKGSVLLGYSPDTLAAINWVMASTLAGLFGILVGPITALNPQTYTILIVPALAAALIGRFVSFGITTAAAIGLGMLQTEILHLQAIWTWVPKVGVQQAVPFVIIIVAMILLGGRLPGRGSIVEGRLPAALRARRPFVLGVPTFGVGIILCFALSGAYLGAFVTSLIGAIVCLSLVVLTGYVGQLSLAQMTFAGIAGFAVSRFAHNMHIPFPISPILAIAVAVIAGLLAGLPAIRIRGVSLAVVTIGLAVAVSEFVFKNPDYTGGFNGATVPEPTIFGFHLGTGGDHSFAVFALIVLTGACALVCNLRRSGTGLRMLAVRANERAAAAAGISVATTKLMAFGISAGLAGLSGVMLGYSQTTLSFESFDVLVSLAFFATAYLGGIATVSGAVVGGLLTANGLLFYFLDQEFQFGKYVLLISGLGLILTAVLNPEGIAGGFRLTVLGLRSKMRRGNGPSADVGAPVALATTEVPSGPATAAR
jgi:branched-chain amino acid transport system permease protein